MRTIAEIYQDIITFKDAQTQLQGLAPDNDAVERLRAGLASTTRVAIWRLWAYVTAVAIWTHESLFELFKTEIQDTVSKGIAGTARWYRDRVFEFQFGDSLEYNSMTGKYGYAVLDESKQIVTRCAIVEEASGVLSVKVAKGDDSALAPLATAELTALSSYVKAIRFAGTRFQIVSGTGDILRPSLTIYHDGNIPEATVSVSVQAAIQTHVASLPFNGDLLVSALVDEIQQVEGVIDVVVNLVGTSTTPSGQFVPIARIHNPQFGYYVFDTTPGFTLDDTIAYIAQ